MKLDITKMYPKNANASLLKRLVAFVLDFLIIEMIIVWPFGRFIKPYVVEGSFSSSFNSLLANDAAFQGLYPVIFAITILSIAYFTLFEFYYQQTIGKMLMKLKVISLQKKLTVNNCIIRSLFIIPFYLITFIDIIYVFFNKENQRVLEFLTKTKTVSV